VDIQAVAGAWLNGQPLYPKPADGLFYGLLYGPLLYEILAVAERCFGIGDAVTVLPGILAELAAIVLTWRTSRRMGASRKSAWIGTGVMIALLCEHCSHNGPRADSFLVLLAALALATLPGLENGNRFAPVWLGVCCGLSGALKISGIFYCAPALLCVLIRPGKIRWTVLGTALLGGAIGFALPYLVPGAGFVEHWRFWTELHPLRLSLGGVRNNLVLAASWLLPLLAIRPGLPDSSDYRLFAGVSIALLPTLFVAAADGTGPWHFLPFFPPLAFLLARTVSGVSLGDYRQFLLLSVLAGVAVAGLNTQWIEIGRSLAFGKERQHTRAALADFLAANPGASVAIAPSSGEPTPGGTRPMQMQHAWLVGAGQPLGFTVLAWSDMRSREHADRFIEKQLAGCRSTFWLNQPGEPFPQFGNDPEMFAESSQIQKAFYSSYVRVSRTPAFDVWACRSAGSSDHPSVGFAR
jgi:hypothetical protein